MRRVVITGLGAVTPLGNNVEDFWNGLKEGRSGINMITRFDTTDYKVKIAGEVKDFDASVCGDMKTVKRMELFSRYAVAASREAFEDAGLDMEKEDPFRVGVSIGSGIGALQVAESGMTRLLEKGPGRVDPLLIPRMISNMAAGNVAISFGLKGKNINVVTACASGTHSIGEAFRSIQHGEAEVMLCGGTEAAVTPLSIAGFTQLTALTTDPDPDTASRPFDKDRHGFVLGEGAGVIVLEELEHAKARGAHIYAEFLGYGATCDAYHITSPAEDGSGAAMAMSYAIKDAGLEPEDIDYINAHGTGTPLNDLFETRAIKLCFGEHARELKINSTKSMTGHLLGAAGGIEAVVLTKSVEEDYVHVTRNLRESEEELDLDYCRGEGCHTKVDAGLSNSLGFGGHNATIVIGKYKD